MKEFIPCVNNIDFLSVKYVKMKNKADKYSIYNFTILSEIELPELKPSQQHADVTVSISRSKFDHWKHDERSSFGLYTNQEALISFKDIATFIIREGREVVISANPKIDSRVARMFFHGVVTAILLYQRGLLVLHGSCMDINGKAVGFLGESGAGKSTMAAGLHCLGHDILSEDIVAIDYCSNRHVTFPGMAQLKLSADSIACMGYSKSLIESLYPLSDEFIYRYDRKLPSARLNMSCIFILSDGDRVDIHPLSNRDSFMALMRNTYTAAVIEQTKRQESHFAQCSQLLKNIPVYLLERPRDLKQLPDVSKMVEAFVMGLP